MADPQPNEGSSTSTVSSGSSGATLQLNVKTLDSRIYSFHVDKNIIVSEFKENIATQSGVPVGQQRLIFRGKVLKDDHPLSEYNVENGDTLHLVERQPHPSMQPGSSSGDPTASNSNRGQDSTAGGSRNRIGHIAHTVVLGPLNVGDPGEAVVPDISRVIGAVLNSIGVGNLAGGVQPGGQTSRGIETDGSWGYAGSHSQGVSLSVPAEALHGQSTSSVMQMPPGAAIDVPTLNMPIPHSLNTLAEFMNRMELAFSQNDNESNQPPVATGDQSNTELPMDHRAVPTVETLSIVLRQAQRLLTGHAIPALSLTANRLDQAGGSNDPEVRGQVQTESIQLGIAMQHLGALLLELGRTLLTLRLGQSPAESFVNAGPAVYISSSGPNPIMVQPFPLQTSSLFGGSSGVAPNTVAMGPVGVSSIQRNVNIHIHAGASLAPIVPPVSNRAHNGEERQGERVDGTQSVDSTQARVLLGTNVTATTVPMQPGTVSVSGDTSASSEVSHNMSGASGHAGNLELPLDSNQGKGPDVSSDVPIGLGLGGLQPKRRGRRPKPQSSNSDGASASSQNQESREVGQQVLQSLAALSTKGNRNAPLSRQSPDAPRSVVDSFPTPRQNADSQTDVAEAMSEFLHNPTLDGLLSGVSQQTGVGSPDMFRNVLQQFTQNPAMRNTMNQIAQQIDSHDLGSMFSHLDSGSSGQIDLGRMMQQMMPIVSQALGGVSSVSQITTPMQPGLSQNQSSRRDVQIDLQRVVQRLENQSSSEEIFRSLVDSAVHVSSNGSARGSVVNELCSQRGLAQEFMEMFHHDMSQRLQDERGS